MHTKKIQIDVDDAESYIDGIIGGYNDVMSNEGIRGSEPYLDDTIDVLIIPDANAQGKYPAIVAGDREETVDGYIAGKGW